MPRATKLISETGKVDLTFAGDIAIANVGGVSPMWVVPSDELSSVDDVEDMTLRNSIFNSMYRLLPGERRVLQKGVYSVILGGTGQAFISCNGQIRTSITA